MPAITNVNELQAMNNDLAGTYWLSNDIDASATSGWNGGAGFVPIGTFANGFTGSFKGKHYTIIDLHINRPAEGDIGLFGYAETATLQNVTFTGADITGDDDVGCLVGEAHGCIISNCHSAGEISGVGDYIGGLVGFATHHGGVPTTTTDCSSSCTVDGDDYVGGIIGYAISAITSDSFATGSITSIDDFAGGLIGRTYNNTISGCYSTGDVTCGDDYGGGLIGYAWSDTITNCYARGSVGGDQYIGGLIGYIPSGTITNCFSTGVPTGNNDVGGLIGSNSGTVSNSFWDTTTSGTAVSDGGTGKTTSEMKTKSTFTDAAWDFIVVWFINGVTNDGYPFHWAMPPEPIESPRETVDIQDKITLECVRNIEMAAGGRFYIDKEGKANYRSRYARNA